MPTAPLRWRLTITRHDRDGMAVFVAEGRIGTLSAGDLIEALASAIAAGDAPDRRSTSPAWIT